MKVNNKILGLGLGIGFITLAEIIVLGTGNSGLSENCETNKLFATKKQINSEVEEVLCDNFYNVKVINNGDNIIVTVADCDDNIGDDRYSLDDLAELIKNHYKDYGYDTNVTVILLNTNSDVMGYAKE